MDFEMISVQDTLKRIFQALGKGTSRILYYWTKDLKLDSFYGAKNHVFSDARREMNILTGSQTMRYWNNRSFYSVFGNKRGLAIKEYMRKRKINVKRAVDQTMTELIYYCNSLESR